MQRYLCDLSVTGNLSAGRDVEQLLPDRYELDQRVIRIVSIEQVNLNAWTVRLCEVFDNGAPGFIDVYEFEAVDPDHPFGTEWTFDSVDGALRFARDVLRTSQRALCEPRTDSRRVQGPLSSGTVIRLWNEWAIRT